MRKHLIKTGIALGLSIIGTSLLAKDYEVK